MATPSPEPHVLPLGPVDPSILEFAGDLVIVSIALVVFGGFMTFALLRAAKAEPKIMVTLSLSLLTLVAIIGFITTASEVCGTLAATGLGAISGAVSTIFRDGAPPADEPPTPKDERPVEPD